MNLRPTWAEINLEAFASNLKAIRNIVGENVKVMAVVKANAYGHGAVDIANIAIKNGADMLAVATLDEAVKLREAEIKWPILVLGTNIPGDGLATAVHHDITQALCTRELAEALSITAEKQNKKALVHLKVDTGMSRIGVRPRETLQFMKEVNRLSGIKFEGIFSHFAAADDFLNSSYTMMQLIRFKETVSKLGKEGYRFPICHIANSAAIVNYPESHLDMVRPGGILYGSPPSQSIKDDFTFKPTIALKTRIVYIKKVPKDTLVSYGLTYKTSSEQLLATIPIGYADGYPRGLSNRGQVLVHGQRCRVVGRICMDQCVIDVTGVKGVTLGDEVVLIGKQGSESITPRELADLLDTIDLEIMCGISARVPRVYKRPSGDLGGIVP